MKYPELKKTSCEYLRHQAKQKFEIIKPDWIDYGTWALPHKTRHLLGIEDGRRNSHGIVDPTHRVALRSYVAGFLEGNTSASRPWARHVHPDPDVNRFSPNKQYLEKLTRKTLTVFAQSNFYDAAAQFYYEYGVFNTGCMFVDRRPGNRLHFFNLDPGSYFIINNAFGEPEILVREFSLTVKALVGRYGLQNVSKNVKKMYEEGNYTTKIECCHIIKPNEKFNANGAPILLNRPWLSIAYELGPGRGGYDMADKDFESIQEDPKEKDNYLSVNAFSWKPFIVGKSPSSNNYEYGETGPTEMAYGLVRSTNKKAISKDLALEQLVKPTMQGPASLKNSYRTNQANTYIPLDPTSLAQGGMKKAFDINPAIAALIEDVGDLRQIIEKIYYADFLLFLSRNPKTRTATETNAVRAEQQLIIGPNLQSLNLSFNVPLFEFATQFVLDTDLEMTQEIPEGLQGASLKSEFISVFAQAQRAADLPSIEQYMQAMTNIASIDPRIFDKVNLDKFADLYEDRLYLPEGLNRNQADVDAHRQRMEQAAARKEELSETVPALAGAAKDLGIQVQQ